MVDTPSGNVSAALFVKESIPLSSLASALPIKTDVSGPVASIIISSGTDMVGFVKSFGILFTSGIWASSSVISFSSGVNSGLIVSGSITTCSFPAFNLSRTTGVESF